MNLAYHYPIIYWNCACLSVDSSAINPSDFYNLIEDDIVVIDDDENKKTQNKMDYAKLAAALDKFRSVCTINLPDINKSKLSFTPDVNDNSILYGLKGISHITDPVIEEIIMNRPFNSFIDFYNRVSKRIITKDKVINLIKCGAFNALEGKSTEEILKNFITITCGAKNKLTLQNAAMLIEYNLFPSELNEYVDVYQMTKEFRRHRDSLKLWYMVDKLIVPADKIATWVRILGESGVTGQEIMIDGAPRKVVDSRKWDAFYEKQMSHLKSYIIAHQQELLNQLNNILFQNEYNKYCEGDVRQWQLDSLNFYFDQHPLIDVVPQIQARTNVLIDNVEDIVEDAQDGEFFIKGKVIPKMKLFTVVGTVIDRDKTKSLVTVQCPSGVISVKVYKDLYATMTQVIGDLDTNGERDVEQESFFEKGVHLMITGIQRGSTFIPKVYRNTGRKAILRIVLDDRNNFVKLEEKIGG